MRRKPNYPLLFHWKQQIPCQPFLKKLINYQSLNCKKKGNHTSTNVEKNQANTIAWYWPTSKNESKKRNENTPTTNGNTGASYSADSWSQSCGFLGLGDCGLTGEFCGSIENNSFLTFVASSSSISFDVWVFNSQYGDGIQIMIFDAVNCSGTVNSYYCSQLAPSAGSQNVSANGLTPGNTYYIMIDGYAGDVCDYVFAANSGVQIPVDVTPANSNICPGGTVNLTASGGNGTFNWNASPDLNTTSGANVVVTPPHLLLKLYSNQVKH